MDNKLIIIEELLDKKKEKYPNIVSIWKKFIDIKTKHYEKHLDKCIELFNNIEKIKQEDLDNSTILILYILGSNITNLNT